MSLNHTYKVLYPAHSWNRKLTRLRSPKFDVLHSTKVRDSLSEEKTRSGWLPPAETNLSIKRGRKAQCLTNRLMLDKRDLEVGCGFLMPEGASSDCYVYFATPTFMCSTSLCIYALFVTFFDHCMCFEDVISFLLLNMLHFDRRDCIISQLYSVKPKRNFLRASSFPFSSFICSTLYCPSKSH